MSLEERRDFEEKKALKEGDVPKWDGTTSRREYYDDIDLWAAQTSLPERYRALRLMQCLRGGAKVKMKHIKPDVLKKKDGIAIFKKKLDYMYEPIEEFRVGKVMDEFLYRFYRYKGTDKNVYNHELEQERKSAVKISLDQLLD